MAKKSFSNTCNFPASAEESYALLTNAEYLASKYGKPEKPVQVTVTPTATGHDVVIERELEINDPPAVVKPFVKEVMTLRFEQKWQKTSTGYSATLDYRLLDTPAHIDGTLELKDQGDSTALSADLMAHVNVPFVGGKGSKLLAEGAQKRIQQDFEANIKALS